MAQTQLIRTASSALHKGVRNIRRGGKQIVKWLVVVAAILLIVGLPLVQLIQYY